MSNSLSVCIVVKNEESNLKELLPLIRPFVSELLVADTGSTDQSIEIARIFADQVLELPGKTLTEGRNATIERASSDWILTLDADERIMPQDMLLLSNSLSQLETNAYRLPIFNYLGEWRWSVSCVIRLFRGSAQGRWGRTMHESLSAAFTQIQVGILESFAIHHFSKFTTTKKERYLRTMQEYLTDNAQDFHAMEHYACELYTAGFAAEAKEMMQKVLESLPDFQRAYKDLAYMYLCENHYAEAKQNLRMGMACKGEQTCLRAALYCGLAQVYEKQKQYEKAIEVLLEGIDQIRGEKSALYLNLSKLYDKSGLHSLSLDYERKAIRMNPFLLDERTSEKKEINNSIYSLDGIIL